MAQQQIPVGIMKMDVAGEDARSLSRLTRGATDHFTRVLDREPRLTIESLTFDGPPLRPAEEGYRALDFVQIGITEKTERRLAFLIIITEVEITAASLSYLLALPSQLTNVAIITTRRLADYGSGEDHDEAVLTDRLATLMLHCFGRLLNLDYHPDPTNYLSRIAVADDLDAMRHFTDRQFDRMAINLPKEANDRFSEGSRLPFVLQQIASNLPVIVRGALRAGPVRIASKLPTMIATALSVIVLLIFGGETWDFAASVSGSQLTVFVVASFAAATFVLYRAFSFRLVATRQGAIAESSVVTAAATYLALILTLLVLFIFFALLMYGVVVFVFPDPLMSNWTSDKDGATFDAHLRLVLFLAAVGVLSGSLGGSADSRSVVRNVLFGVDET
jgi:predicted Zn-dependent protease